jgi:hypothetical protein
MIITVPYTYQFHYIPKGKRIPVEARVRDTVDVMIDELDPSEAPLVLTMPSKDLVSPLEVEYRHHRDSLWSQKVVHTYSGGERKIVTLDEVADMVARRVEAYGMSCFWTPPVWRDEKAIDSTQGLEIREIVKDTREADAEKIRRNAMGSISVGGVLFQRVPEPVVCLRMDLDHASFETADYSGEPIDKSYYRMDRLAELEEIAREWRRTLNLHELGEDAFRDHRITVYRPDLLRFDDETNALYQQTREFVEALPALLRDGSKDFLCAYADLRDAWKPVKGRPEMAENVIGEAEAAARALLASGQGGDTAHIMAKAIDRWRSSRGIDDTLALNAAFGATP